MRGTTHRLGRTARPIVTAAERVRRTHRLLVLGWHRVDTIGGGVSTRLEAFEQHLDALEEWGATVLSLDEGVRRLDGGTLPERAVCLTFDDGYVSSVDTAWPLLRKRNWPMTMFVVTDYLGGDRYHAWDADGAADPRARLVDHAAVVDAHRDGMTIGSHTANHPWLPHLDDRTLDDELTRSRDVLEDLLGARVDQLAYPKGGWTPRVWHAAARAGYTTAVTTDRGRNGRRQERLLLRRTIAPDDADDFRLVLDGAYDWLRPLDRWRVRKGPIW